MCSNENKIFLTVAETCILLRVSSSTAARRLREGKQIPWSEAKKIGNRILIPVESLNRLPNYISEGV